MKKAWIPAAVLLSLAGTAHAEYSIYGLIDASVGRSIGDDQTLMPDGVTPKAKANVNFHSGGDNGSGEGNSVTRVGLKGSNDVGPGIKANFRFETGGISSDGKVNGDGTFFARAAWVGLSGGFGEFRFGRQDSVPFQTFFGLDYNGASDGISSAQYSNAGRWLLLGRQSRSLQYLTPALGPVKGQLGLQLKDSTITGSKDVASGGATFAASGVTVAAAFQTKAVEGGNDYYGVAAEYDFGMAKVTLGYHDQKTDGKGFTAGTNFSFGNLNVGGVYYKETNLTKGQAFELYVNKEVLKSTYAYAEVGVADKNANGPSDGYGKGTGFAVGLIYTF